MSYAERLYEHVREHRGGLLVDLAFAVTWVTLVTVLFDALDGPQWAYYLSLFSGVVAYYGFFASLEAARGRR